MERLSRVRLFSDLSGRDLRHVVDVSNVVTYDEGDVIITEGESGVGFQLILEGEAKVVRNGRTLARLGPNDFFGEMALIDEGPRTASVIAATPMTNVAIASWDFRPLVKSRPGMAWALLVHLAGRLRDDQKREDSLRA
jgi:CRP-like cAMP-binding protein